MFLSPIYLYYSMERDVIFFDFLDENGLILSVTRHVNNLWLVRIADSLVRDGGEFEIAMGSGQSFLDALANYIDLIRGRTIVISTNTTEEREIDAPDFLVIRKGEKIPSQVGG